MGRPDVSVWCLLPTLGGVWMLQVQAPPTADTAQVVWQGTVQTCKIRRVDESTRATSTTTSVRAPAPQPKRAFGERTPIIGSSEQRAEKAYTERREREIRREIGSICSGC
jgi:hypothetical protein